MNQPNNPMPNQIPNQMPQQNGGLRLDGLLKPLDGLLGQAGLPVQLGPITSKLTDVTNGLTGGLAGTLQALTQPNFQNARMK